MSAGDEGLVYELHFDQPIGDPENAKGQAQHYIGHTDLVGSALAQIREAEAEQPQHHGGPAGPAGNEMEEQMQEYDADAAEGADYDAAVDPDIEAAADLADADVAREAFEAQLAPQDRTWLQEVGERYQQAGEPEFDADGNPAADRDADAAQYEHDPDSWLARDGDTVREVAADGTPGREASPDDGRPVAEPEEPANWQAEAESAAWGGREPSRSYAEWAAEGRHLEAEAG